MPLTQDEIDGCRDAFLAFDKDRSGTIDVWELRQVLEAMGQKPTEEELFQMISEVDDNMSGSIDFGEFLKVSFRHSHALHVYDLIYRSTFLPSSSWIFSSSFYFMFLFVFATTSGSKKITKTTPLPPPHSLLVVHT